MGDKAKRIYIRLKIYFIFLLLLLFVSINTKSANIDSILSLIKFQKEDSTKVDLLLELTEQLKLDYRDSETIVYAKQAYLLSEKLHYTKGEAQANYRIAKT